MTDDLKTERLDMERDFGGPPELVWRALTDPVALPEWFWPFPATADIELRPGGAYRIAAPAKGIAIDATLTGVTAPRTLSLDWRWAGETERTHVDIAIDAVSLSTGTGVNPGTRLRLTHAGFATPGTRDDHIEGWDGCLDRLSTWMETRP